MINTSDEKLVVEYHLTHMKKDCEKCYIHRVKNNGKRLPEFDGCVCVIPDYIFTDSNIDNLHE